MGTSKWQAMRIAHGCAQVTVVVINRCDDYLLVIKK
jgi:hypothetical protein